MIVAMQEGADHAPVLDNPQAKGKGSKLGEVLAFVRGLRLSARLVYILRNRLTDYDVSVHWGHVQDGNRGICSPECDIIIHQGGEAARWNGSTDQDCVMDFRFIKAPHVLAVISCKSKTDGIDPDFARVLKKKFKVKHVYIFAESIKATAKKRLSKEARSYGYKGFWYLYEFRKLDERAVNRDVYMDFLKKLRNVLPLKPTGMKKAS